jgi:dGTPase
MRMIRSSCLLTLEQLLELPLWREARDRVENHAKLKDRQLRRAIVHEILDWQVSDVIERSQRDLPAQKIGNVVDVRKGAEIIQPSDELGEKKSELEGFYSTKCRHPGVLVRRVRLNKRYGEFCRVWLIRRNFRLNLDAGRSQKFADGGRFLAGMTDRA